MEEKLKVLMANVFDLREHEITEDTSMNTVNSWDSLKHMQLVVAIEEEYEIPRLSVDEIVEMTSVASIRRILRDKGVTT